MFRIAICDDDMEICNQIKCVLSTFLATEKAEAEIDIYHSGKKLFFSLKKGNEYNLIYLDIELSYLNGIAIGLYIREEQKNENTQIVFISADPSYALQLFQVRPLDFLVKPLKAQQVIHTLEKTFTLSEQQTKLLPYLSDKIKKRVPFKDIIYLSSDAKRIILHLKNGTDYFYGKLSALRLPKDFLVIHKSFIVNLNSVVQFKFNCVLLSNGEILPISRAHHVEVQEYIGQWNRE